MRLAAADLGPAAGVDDFTVSGLGPRPAEDLCSRPRDTVSTLVWPRPETKDERDMLQCAPLAKQRSTKVLKLHRNMEVMNEFRLPEEAVGRVVDRRCRASR